MLSSESEKYPEWKALLTEVLAAVAKRLTSIADYSSFRGVCTSWRCAATFDNFDREFPRAPRLLYFVKETEEEDREFPPAPRRRRAPVLDAWETEEREGETTALSEVSEETPIHEKIVANFLDLESNTSKIAKFPPQSPYEEYLSCSGWILVSNETETSLKHFMLGINIKLPLLDNIISKMVLSGSPMESGVVVMESGNFFEALHVGHKKVVEVFASPPYDDKFSCVEQRFLVESFGKILLVLQYMSRNQNESYYYFRIFEIELKDGIRALRALRWRYKEIDNIGDRCLFLGFNSSISVSSTSLQLKPNCIYFSKNKKYCALPHVGVFNRLGDGGGGYFEDFSCRFDFCSPLPVWVVPSI